MTKWSETSLALNCSTGTTSMMSQTTSGIEPVFMPVYKRRRKSIQNDIDVHIDFIDEMETVGKNMLFSTTNLLHGWKLTDIQRRKIHF